MPIAHERACDLCISGVTVDGVRRCGNPQALPPGRPPEPVQRMRAREGACGPDARFLDFPGLR